MTEDEIAKAIFPDDPYAEPPSEEDKAAQARARQRAAMHADDTAMLMQDPMFRRWVRVRLARGLLDWTGEMTSFDQGRRSFAQEMQNDLRKHSPATRVAMEKEWTDE